MVYRGEPRGWFVQHSIKVEWFIWFVLLCRGCQYYYHHLRIFFWFFLIIIMISLWWQQFPLAFTSHWCAYGAVCHIFFLLFLYHYFCGFFCHSIWRVLGWNCPNQLCALHWSKVGWYILGCFHSFRCEIFHFIWIPINCSVNFNYGRQGRGLLISILQTLTLPWFCQSSSVWVAFTWIKFFLGLFCGFTLDGMLAYGVVMVCLLFMDCPIFFHKLG